jgi:hypothetical protein
MFYLFKKTIFRYTPEGWQFIRFKWKAEANYFETYAAACGQTGIAQSNEHLLPNETKEIALHRLAAVLQKKGYIANLVADGRVKVKIIIPPWKGFLASAPWFDELQTAVVHPLFTLFETTGNGDCVGVATALDYKAYDFGTINLAAALEGIKAIEKTLPSIFKLEVQASNVSTDSTVKNVEAKAETETTKGEFKGIAEIKDLMSKISEDMINSIKKLAAVPAPASIGYPDCSYHYIEFEDPSRVQGAVAKQLREQLLEKWGVGKDVYWPPLSLYIPCELLHVEGILKEKESFIIEVIQQRQQGQLYVLDIQEGMWTLPTEDLSFQCSLNDTFFFDDGLEWVVFFSHHNTLTFGGDWLMAAVREAYREELELLNCWYEGGIAPEVV